MSTGGGGQGDAGRSLVGAAGLARQVLKCHPDLSVACKYCVLVHHGPYGTGRSGIGTAGIAWQVYPTHCTGDRFGPFSKQVGDRFRSLFKKRSCDSGPATDLDACPHTCLCAAIARHTSLCTHRCTHLCTCPCPAPSRSPTLRPLRALRMSECTPRPCLNARPPSTSARMLTCLDPRASAAASRHVPTHVSVRLQHPSLLGD